MLTTIKILRVNGIRTREPVVLAIVDDHLVRWRPREGWTCDCDPDADECEHVDPVADLLDHRVLGDDR